MQRPRPAVLPTVGDGRAPRVRGVLLGAALAVGLAVVPASADAAGLPTSPVGPARVTVTTPSGWTVEEHGPKNVQDDVTTQIVVRRPGGAIDALLYPEEKADGLCDAQAEGYHCQPLRNILGGTVEVGKDGLLVTDQNGDGIPEVAIGLFSLGAHCCIVDVGYWRDPSGVWKSDSLNGGSAGGLESDASGRLQTADPAFEALDWSYAEGQFFLTWARLIPGTGWVDASTAADHRREITRLDGVVKQYAGHRVDRFVVKAARAVRIAHRRAIGQTARVASERRTYRKAYGATALRRLDQALKSVPRVGGAS